MAPNLQAQYLVGQSVQFTPDGYADVSTHGAYTVTRILPRDQQGWHYHVRNVGDGHTRHVHEMQLRPVPGA